MIYLSIPPSNPAHWAAVRAGDIGVITTPDVGRRGVSRWPIWAADNGCYAAGERFDGERFLAWLMRHRQHASRALFAVAPDVVADARGTRARSASFLAPIRSAGYRVAYVAQNGLSEHPPPWGDIDALFIGGCTDWKLGEEAARACREAKRRGLWLHAGRVNSWKRMAHFAALGADSADGTLLAFGPDTNLARVHRWRSLLAEGVQTAWC